MDKPVELLPLVCIKCQAPVPAQPDEVAWVCKRCGQGLALDESKGLAPLEVQYLAGIPPNTQGRPFWVTDATVTVERQAYGLSKNSEAERYWAAPRRFFVPAYTCPLETLLDLGSRLLLQPPTLQAGPAVDFAPVTLPPGDVQSLVEFVVIAVEAGRSDMLKQVQVNARLTPPVLWIFP